MPELDWELAVTVLCATPEYKGRAPISEEEYIEKLNKEAAKAGFDNANEYRRAMRMKDPAYLESAARLYGKCVAKRGAKDVICKGFKDIWLKCKAVQNVD